jgi:hypothetical protein
VWTSCRETVALLTDLALLQTGEAGISPGSGWGLIHPAPETEPNQEEITKNADLKGFFEMQALYQVEFNESRLRTNHLSSLVSYPLFIFPDFIQIFGENQKPQLKKT